MCTQATLDKIHDVVTDFVNGGRMFTAFEVSLEVQKQQKTAGETPERHRNMKREIHGELQQYLSTSLYNCQNHSVGADGGQQLLALVYYPAGADPSTYVPLDRSDSPKTTSVPAATSMVTSVSTPSLSLSIGNSDSNDSDSSDKGRKPDARGVVCVPNFLLRVAGFQHKDIAYVISRQENGKDVIVLTKRPSITPIATYTVDTYQNVRITRATLDAAGIGKDGATYDFEGNTNSEVTVRIHQ